MARAHELGNGDAGTAANVSEVSASDDVALTLTVTESRGNMPGALAELAFARAEAAANEQAATAGISRVPPKPVVAERSAAPLRNSTVEAARKRVRGPTVSELRLRAAADAEKAESMKQAEKQARVQAQSERWHRAWWRRERAVLQRWWRHGHVQMQSRQRRCRAPWRRR